LKNNQFGFYPDPFHFNKKVWQADGVLGISGEEFEGVLEAMETRERVLRERKTKPNLEENFVPGQDEEMVLGERLY
jgi:hypothetical protein